MDWIRSLFWLKEYCNFILMVKHIPGTFNTLPGSNDFASYMSPLPLAPLRSKGSAATWPWSHQFPAPSRRTYYQVHLLESKAFMPILLCLLRLAASPKSSINPYSLCSFSGKVTLSNLHPSLFKCGSHSTPWTWPDWPNQKQFQVGNYTSRKPARKTFNSVPKETDYTPFPISLQESLKFKSHLNLDNSVHATFWAVCLVTFFGLLRKASLQCKGFTQFNLFKHYAGETYSSLLTRPASSIDGQKPFNLVSAF